MDCRRFTTVSWILVSVLTFASGCLEAVYASKSCSEWTKEMATSTINPMSLTLSEIVDMQVQAYNSRDLTKFLSFYADQIQIFVGSLSAPTSLPETPVISGIDAFAKFYRDAFAQSPNLNAKILSREVKDNQVIDDEQITGLRGNDQALSAKVTYTFENQKITRVIILK